MADKQDFPCINQDMRVTRHKHVGRSDDVGSGSVFPESPGGPHLHVWECEECHFRCLCEVEPKKG